jgi:hypothetical protein
MPSFSEASTNADGSTLTSSREAIQALFILGCRLQVANQTLFHESFEVVVQIAGADSNLNPTISNRTATILSTLAPSVFRAPN